MTCAARSDCENLVYFSRSFQFAFWHFRLSRQSYIWFCHIFHLADGSLLRILLWVIIVSVWAISQGGLGACAFLGTSVITKSSLAGESTARDNVDLTDRNFLIIRVILGTLFAVLLGLPFSPLGLNVFIPLYWKHDVFPSQSDLVFSLIPFLAGFSTNLVLVILGKFVVAIEAVFGLSGRT